ncbi:MAG: alpha/beta fold hydrolase, partial [Candidatus Hodarchaeota archaeon]
TILRFDLRGHGRSTKPKKRFTIRDYGNDLVNLLENIGWNEDLYFIGHSLGGMVALVYALENSSKIKKMVISNSYCFVSNEAISDTLGRIKSVPLPKFALGMGKRLLSPYNEDLTNFIAQMVRDHMTAKDCLYATAASAGFNICRTLKSLPLPTLILVGRNDILTPVYLSEMLHEWLPQSELVVMPEAGHMIILNHAAEFNSHVKRFFARD